MTKTVEKVFAAEAHYDLGNTSIKSQSDFISMIGSGLCAMATYKYDFRLFAEPKLTFYDYSSEDNEAQPEMVLSGNIDILDVFEGLSKHDVATFTLGTNPHLMAGMLKYTVIFTTDYDYDLDEPATFSAVGIFEDSENARQKAPDLMEYMINMIQCVLIGKDMKS